MRALVVVLLISMVGPLKAQPVPKGDLIRVREGKGAPWATGLYAGSDSASIVLMQDGIEQVYALLAIERIDWKAPRRLALELPLGTVGGAVLGLGVELFSLLLTSGCWDILVDTGECNEDWGKAAKIGAAAGAGWVLISYAIWPRVWRVVTNRYPPAGTTH